jgi:hypothetical protein
MKSLSGRDFARFVERRGWRLLRSTAAITSTERRARVTTFHSCTREYSIEDRLLRYLAKLSDITDDELK